MKLQSIQPVQMQDLHLLFLWMIMYSSHKMIWSSHMRDEKKLLSLRQSGFGVLPP